jgi:hypothetical protein
MKKRLKEHNVDTIYGRIKKYVVVEHSHTSKHYICMEDTRVIKKSATLPKNKDYRGFINQEM